MPTPDARKRVMVVVLDANLTDNAAGSIRHGLRMFRGVSNVYPVDAPPCHDGSDLMDVIRDQVLGEGHAENRRLQQAVDELVGRIRNVQEAVTGGLPAQSFEQRDALDEAPFWTRKDKTA